MKPPGAVRIKVVRCGITAARVGVARLHRHHKPPVGGLVAFEALGPDGWGIGWAVVGRPVSRHLQSAGFVEVTRVATDGTPNACSALYGAASRWAKANGSPVITYTLETEPGTSLAGAGWVEVGRTKAAQWSSKSRPRKWSATGTVGKIKWAPAWCAEAAK